MRLSPQWRRRLIGLLLIAAVGVGLSAVLARHPAADRADALVASVARSKAIAAHDSAALTVAKATTDGAVDTLHRRVVVYDTVRHQVVLHPTTAADTVRDIALLPSLVATCDSVALASARLEAAAARERARAEALDGARRRTIAAQDSLIAVLAYHPRLSGDGAFLYDPVAHVYGVSADVRARTVGAWQVGARGQAHFAAGERWRGDVVVSHPLF